MRFRSDARSGRAPRAISRLRRRLRLAKASVHRSASRTAAGRPRLRYARPRLALRMNGWTLARSGVTREGNTMSSTIRVEESVQIDKSPVAVWDAIADYGFDLEWRKGLREMTPDPPGPPASGTRVHEVVRTSGSRLCRRHGGDRCRSRRLLSIRRCGHDRGLSGGRAVRAEGPGTGAVLHLNHRAAAKGRDAPTPPTLGSMVRSGLRKDLHKLKAILESRQ